MEPNHVQKAHRDLLQRLAANDEDAFREIYDRYWRKIYSVGLRYLRSPDEAQDVVQEVFCVLWDKRETFLQVNNLENYLLTITHHHIYRTFRLQVAESRHNRKYTDVLDLTRNDTDHLVRANQYEEILSGLIEQLPPQQKLVFRMAREQGMTHEAIAEKLNLTQGTVKNHLVRALSFLRKNFSPHLSSFLLFPF